LDLYLHSGKVIRGKKKKKKKGKKLGLKKKGSNDSGGSKKEYRCKRCGAKRKQPVGNKKKTGGKGG